MSEKFETSLEGTLTLDISNSCPSFSHWNLFIEKFQLVKSVYEDFLAEMISKKNQSVNDSQFELALFIVNQEKIQTLNKDYRQKDKVTDVLSFPTHEEHELPMIEGEALVSLGDIFICYQVAENQAKEHNLTTIEEIFYLFTHGFLHILGYDHERSAEDEALMQEKEDFLMKIIQKKIR